VIDGHCRATVALPATRALEQRTKKPLQKRPADAPEVALEPFAGACGAAKSGRIIGTFLQCYKNGGRAAAGPKYLYVFTFSGRRARSPDGRAGL
jgi:hypothetical protein